MLFPEEGGIDVRSPNQLVLERAMLLTLYDVITVIHVIFLYVLANSSSKTQLKSDLLRNLTQFPQIKSFPFSMLSQYSANFVPVSQNLHCTLGIYIFLDASLSYQTELAQNFMHRTFLETSVFKKKKKKNLACKEIEFGLSWRSSG